jgi:hypothetical protein
MFCIGEIFIVPDSVADISKRQNMSIKPNFFHHHSIIRAVIVAPCPSPPVQLLGASNLTNGWGVMMILRQ